MDKKLQDIQDQIDLYKNQTDKSVGELSDGYHSFNDLYDHRVVLSAFMFNKLRFAYKTHKHFDNDTNPMYEGMFLVGAITPYGQISYHYDNKYWNLFHVPAIEKAPEWDGHSPEDVVDRITKIVQTDSNTNIVNGVTMSLAEKYLIPCCGGTYKDFVFTFLRNVMENKSL